MTNEEEVLLSYAVEPTHDRKTLEKYLTDYPEYARTLIACSIVFMVDATRSAEFVGTSENAVNRAWQRFQKEIGNEKVSVGKNHRDLRL